MEPLNLAVGLRAVWPGLLHGDAEIGAGVTPEVGFVAAAVVAEHALDGDATLGEPGNRVLEHVGRGFLGLVVAGLDVGDAGVVVDHRVQVAGPHQCTAVLVARLARCRCTVLVALLAPDVAPAPAVGDLADLLHIHVDQVAGFLVLVAADGLTGCAVDVGKPVEPATDQDRVHGRGRHVESVGDLDRSEPLLPAQVHDLADHWCWCPVRLVTRRRGPISHAGRTLGLVAVRPLLRGLPRHVVALGGPGRRPAVVDDQTRQPQSGAWRQGSVGMGSVGHEGLLGVKRFLDSSTPHREAFTHLRHQIVSSHDLDQRAWASQLGQHR